MDKRLLITVAISAVILLGWTVIQQRYFPPPPDTVADNALPAPMPPLVGAPAATSSARDQGVPANPPQKRAAEERVTVERPGLYRAVFSTFGGSPVELTLLDPQYQVTVDGKNVPINLVRPEAAAPPFELGVSPAPEDVGHPGAVELPLDTAWTLAKKSDEELVFVADAGPLHVEKRWTLPKTGYRFDLHVTVENRGQTEQKAQLSMSVDGWQDPSVKPGGFLSFGRRYNLTEGICDVAGKLHHETLEGALKKPLDESGDVRWVGIGEQFFLSAVAFAPVTDGTRECRVLAQPSGQISSRVYFAPVKIGPSSKVELPASVFMGPKLLDQLDAVTVAGADARLGDAVNYTLEFVARPMFWVLKKIQLVVVNWGVAIIVITILLKLLTIYPTQKSMQSMKAMAKIKPELDKIKERYPDDKNLQNTKTMELYKREGINPLGGCLPMLFQMPIYIAFYSMLSNAVELYRASFIGPIQDMTAPFWPMSIITGALMFLQQRSSPTAQDPQQKTMMYMMPVMFTAFTVFLPSGLTLYILTNTLLTMGHQAWMNRNDPKPSRAR